MPLPQFRALSAAETRRQRRLQVNAMVAARAAQLDGKAFEKLLKGLSDG
jgi:hypothetical protein